MATKWKREYEDYEEKDCVERQSPGDLKGKGRDVEFIPGPASGAMSDLTIETLIAEHRKLWHILRERLGRCLLETEEASGIDGLKFTKAAGDLLATIVKGERLIWGIDDAVLDSEVDDANEVASEMVRVTSPPGTGEAMEGE